VIDLPFLKTVFIKTKKAQSLSLKSDWASLPFVISDCFMCKPSSVYGASVAYNKSNKQANF
ncbi:hypothetical protein, partial [Pseudoalteromonas sp. 69-MNA-CIBAN-0232]|uniref:hypothetical protein n=1 Tax=Pseudoalteromonas sp. 69-MNA-CIBAN-0232 TaxID=3140486 RepID=UPI00331D8BE8